MLLKKEFEFVESSSPITEPISKFGGQPVWINTPHWPLDPYSSEPMLFMGQIALKNDIFPTSDGLVAYIFFGAALEPVTGSALAIVLQNPQDDFFNTHSNPEIKFTSEATGPTIYEFNEEDEMVSKEYLLSFQNLKEEESVPFEERYTQGELDIEVGYNFSKPELAGNKIGGQPIYVERRTPPDCFTSDDWHILLQLAPKQGYIDGYGTNFYPFHMELYGFSIVQIFVSKDYKQVEAYILSP
ncbi:MAG TPA: hypothetical protein DCS93_19035 [Microscillaceae bacterium]|nr:hypothetical protein [Microscillaceae bacterium]